MFYLVSLERLIADRLRFQQIRNILDCDLGLITRDGLYTVHRPEIQSMNRPVDCSFQIATPETFLSQIHENRSSTTQPSVIRNNSSCSFRLPDNERISGPTHKRAQLCAKRQSIGFSASRAITSTDGVRSPRYLYQIQAMETVDYSPLGLGLQLVVERRVPDTAESIRYAMEGDIDGLKRLFCEGLASPRDLSDSRGFSLIRVSHCRLEIRRN